MLVSDRGNTGYDNLFGICLGGEGCIERRETRQENRADQETTTTTTSADGSTTETTKTGGGGDIFNTILGFLSAPSPTQSPDSGGINVSEMLAAKSQENAAKQQTQRMIIIGIVIMLIVVMTISAYILTKD